uniref:Uncharacterized protein n=1 Tax=Arundo donax TaxID=35708 RepID=A0A0A8YEZ0_ARUDO
MDPNELHLKQMDPNELPTGTDEQTAPKISGLD